MFDRSANHTVEQSTLAVIIKLAGGDEVRGKLTVPKGRPLIDVLNGAHAFVEVEPFGGEKTLIAKSSLVTVQPLAGAEVTNLHVRSREAENFDPHTVLGVAPKAAWDEVRRAYLRLAKEYHPDRYSNADLPAEVTAYLAAMARRVNTAYAALEPAYAVQKELAALRQEPIYTSPSMRGQPRD
jgi:hypothetical protein